MIVKLIAILLFALLWLLLLFQLKKQGAKSVVLWLMLALEVVLIGILFLPSRPVSQHKHTLVLSQNSPDSLKTKEGAVQLLPDAHGYATWLQLSRDTNQSISLYGNGLPEDWLSLVKQSQLAYFPHSKINGISRLQLPSAIALGDTLRFPVWITTDERSSLLLQQQDSTVWQSQPYSDSLLWPMHVPTQAGLQHYRLISTSFDTVNIYVQVEAPKAFSIALSASYPSPEQKFLTAWLKEEGHQLYSESSLRPGLAFSTALGEAAPTRLNEAIREADILFFDQNRYQALTTAQKGLLKAAVKNGKSIIFWPEAGKRLPENSGTALQAGQLSLAGNQASALPAISLPADAAGEPLLVWETEAPAAIRRADGYGQWAWLGVQQTYIWQLKGEAEEYARFWRNILRQLSPAEEKPVLRISNWPIRVNRAQTLSLQQNGMPEPGWVISPSGDSLQLKFVEKRPHTGNWQATFWPRELGTYRWQQGDRAVYWEVTSSQAYPATYQQASLPYQQTKASNQSQNSTFPFWKALLAVVTVLLLSGIWMIEKFSQ